VAILSEVEAQTPVRKAAMSERSIPRRTFIRAAAAGAAGLAFAKPLPAYSYSRILGSNDRVRVGIVGFADRARHSLIPSLQEHAKELNFEISAVSDIWSRRREEGVEFVRKLSGGAVRPFRNNEEMYEARTTDAVIISTADFQHALHGIEALDAGQDAYREAARQHDGRRDRHPRRGSAKREGRSDRDAAPKRSQLSDRERVHPQRCVR
jgi:hypothetical protein